MIFKNKFNGVKINLCRPGGEGRVAQVEADQQHPGKDLEATKSSKITINRHQQSTLSLTSKSSITSKSHITTKSVMKLTACPHLLWIRLADTDADGLLDDEEFALAQHLIKVFLFLAQHKGFFFLFLGQHFIKVFLSFFRPASYLV